MDNSWSNKKYLYFLGIGGIGMSALARFFQSKGLYVSGYDRTETELTRDLVSLGIEIHYEESIGDIPACILGNRDNSLIIYTPAIMQNHLEYQMLAKKKFTIVKRAQVLGDITKNQCGLCVAGTHGKTTTSTILAHLLNQTSKGCNAFLGGISSNYNSNLLLTPDSDLVVMEADEYDYSFLQLNPHSAIITSVDADHLDIYTSKLNLVTGFQDFTRLIQEDGVLIIKNGIDFEPKCSDSVTVYRYSLDVECDFYTSGIKILDGLYQFNLHTPWGIIDNLKLGMPGLINVENAVAAISLAILNGAKTEEIREGLASFLGIARRFEYKYFSKQFVCIDDYAHHPEEIAAVVSSVRDLFPDRKITGVFQPHLYTRTRDHAQDFAHRLSQLDQLFLLDIYPARELPIKGVSSSLIFDLVTLPVKELCTKYTLEQSLHQYTHEVLLFMGAGDIAEFVEPINQSFIKSL